MNSRACVRIKSATSVVLPEPALAVTSVTGCVRLGRSLSVKRGRESRAGAGRGGKSLVRRKKVVCDSLAGGGASLGSGVLGRRGLCGAINLCLECLVDVGLRLSQRAVKTVGSRQ